MELRHNRPPIMHQFMHQSINGVIIPRNPISTQTCTFIRIFVSQRAATQVAGATLRRSAAATGAQYSQTQQLVAGFSKFSARNPRHGALQFTPTASCPIMFISWPRAYFPPAISRTLSERSRSRQVVPTAKMRHNPYGRRNSSIIFSAQASLLNRLPTTSG